jgi:transposase
MSQPDLFVGIDVAKDELVIHLHPTGTLWRVANNKTGLGMLGRKLTWLAGTACLRIGFEASGGYERKLAILLDRMGLTAYLLDPTRVRSFARAERQLAKTDPLDAAVIARCLAALHAELTPHIHDPEAIRLAEHVRLRDLAVAQAVQLGNQLESIADTAMRRLIVAQVARLKALALRIEKAIALVIAASPDLAAREALLRTAPGVGPIVAACLLARMPELGRLSSRQVAALAGLAPFDRQSGKTSRPGRCSGGRPSVRRSLYVATLTIARSGKGHLAATTSRLREAGKPFKLAIVATMRKLLITLNAMVKNNTEYRSA